MDNTPKNYMNPYLAGFLLGLVLLAAFLITGRGLGASGAVKNAVVTLTGNIAPEYARQSVFFADYFSGEHPLMSWLVFLVLGVIIGAFYSGAMANRLGFKIERGPGLSARARLVFALSGGLLFGFGAQFGRGCTSGAALSGMAVMSTGGILTMMAIFGTGYLIAYFFRKLWI
ncbi:MAG: YeeE/YedE thiosulfate transporter family protein [Bacteroidales bacterium]|nr:YeeE/YedE thiosulfate transporter family protein [Bacteroidales bacterium]